MRVVVSYDISSDRRRRKVAQIMEGYGYRVQYSVFEVDLDATKLRELQQRLRPLVSKKAGESVRFYSLCAECQKRITVLGVDSAKELGAVLIV
jgi:CRISPR-associated protein Cas2